MEFRDCSPNFYSHSCVPRRLIGWARYAIRDFQARKKAGTGFIHDIWHANYYREKSENVMFYVGGYVITHSNKLNIPTNNFLLQTWQGFCDPPNIGMRPTGGSKPTDLAPLSYTLVVGLATSFVSYSGWSGPCKLQSQAMPFFFPATGRSPHYAGLLCLWLFSCTLSSTLWCHFFIASLWKSGCYGNWAQL